MVLVVNGRSFLMPEEPLEGESLSLSAEHLVPLRGGGFVPAASVAEAAFWSQGYPIKGPLEVDSGFIGTLPKGSNIVSSFWVVYYNP